VWRPLAIASRLILKGKAPGLFIGSLSLQHRFCSLKNIYSDEAVYFESRSSFVSARTVRTDPRHENDSGIFQNYVLAESKGKHCGSLFDQLAV